MNIQGIRPELLAATPTKTSPTSDSNSTTTTASTNGSISESAFMQLIATELQAQDPTQPLDPSQFMGQLVQFGTLNQVTSIYNLLASGANATTSTSTNG